MAPEPLVSVVISAFNVERYIAESLRSILNQDFGNIEVLIADDASMDGTKGVIDGIVDCRIRRFHNKNNVGYLKTWNRLLPLARGKYITFQDGDDVSHPQRIRRLVAFLEDHSGVGLCGSNFIRFFKPWGLYSQSNFPTSQADIERAISQRTIPFAGTRVMIRREVYEKVGGFREFFHGLTWEDYDWILRIMEHYPVANITDVLYEYRYFSRSSSKQSFEPSLKKLFVDKIGFFLAEQRRMRGKDALQLGRPEEIEEYLAHLTEGAQVDFYVVRYKRALGNAIANKDFITAMNLWIQKIKHSSFRLTSLHDVIRILIAAMRTVIKSVLFRIQRRSRSSILT